MSPESGIYPRRLHSRKSSISGPPPASRPTPAGPTTFFLRSERDMKHSPQAAPAAQDDRVKEEVEQTTSPVISPKSMADSSYGVQSLEDALGEAFPSDNTSSESRIREPRLPSLQTTEPLNVGPSVEGSILAGRKRKAGNPVHPKIAAAAQRIISSEHSPTRSSSLASHARVSSSPLRDLLRKTSNTSLDQPPTPLRLSPQPDSGVSSTPRSSSVRSFRLSDEEGSVIDDSSSQILQSSSGEEEDEEEETPLGNAAGCIQARGGAEEAGDGPQLVMPSLAMPSRRPFTERGQRMGRLKVLVAGSAGSGKTNLISSICRSCEDIVHVDPVGGNNSPSLSTRSLRKDSAVDETKLYERTLQITELQASTKAYPSWWSEMEESRVLRRRKSMGDVVLDRNICFIDTPGWADSHINNEEFVEAGTERVIAYIKQLLQQNATLGSMSDSDLLSVLSGGGGCQIDAVLYLFAPDTKAINPAELETVQRISTLTNLIPVISHADAYPDDILTATKATISSQLIRASIRTFTFSQSISEALSAPSNAIFAVSSALGSDSDNMDASLLMAPDYVQPLAPSELPQLIDNLFDPDTIPWLRHTAVRKFLAWRRLELANSLDLRKQQLLNPSYPPRAVTPMPTDSITSVSAYADTAFGSVCSDPSQVLVPYVNSSFYNDASSNHSSILPANQISRYTARRALNSPDTDLGQVRLAKWAEDLQHDLDFDRHRQHSQPDRNRTPEWLRDGVIISIPSEKEREQQLVRHNGKQKHHSRSRSALGFGMDPSDPLGILAFGQRFSRRGWVFLRLLGLGATLGAGAVWVVRNWGVVTELLGVGDGVPGGQEQRNGVGVGTEGWWEGWDWRGLFG